MSRIRPEILAAGALVGLAVVGGVGLGLADQEYLRVLAVTAALAPVLAAREVRRGDVVGWVAAVAVAVLALAAAVTFPVTDVPGLAVGMADPGILLAVALATVVLGAALSRRLGVRSGPT
jgi:hypothetical protein